jgi:hypothetical protein
MVVVDAFYLNNGYQGVIAGGFRCFVEDLITGLIENKYCSMINTFSEKDKPRL